MPGHLISDAHEWINEIPKVLGLVCCFITGPLWCLIENKTVHILDMNRHSCELL